MSYQTLILLPSDAGASLSRALQALQQSSAFDDRMVTQHADLIAVNADGWRLHIRLVSGAHVVEESRDIIQRYGSSRSDRVVLASCDTRFELSGDSDPDMEHINDYILAVEGMTETFGGVAFECHTEQFV